MAFERAVASRRYRRVVLCISAQTGKTDALLDIIGQRLDQKPVPILYVGPNRQFLLEQFEPRLMALLDEAPSLAGKVAKGKRATKSRKVVSGVPLRLAHAGSSTALKSDSVGLAVSDEVDELLANVKGQGDPVGLIEARGDAFPDFVHAVVSTPTRGAKETELDERSGLEFWKVLDGEDVDSTIWKLWQAGTRYHWTWRCPHCLQRFVPRFECLDFKGKADLAASPSEARASAQIVCPRNGCLIGDDEREGMNATGLYLAPGQDVTDDDVVVGEPASSETMSFWVSGLCSPFRSLGDRAAAWLEAAQSGDADRVQTVINAGFGELYAPTAGVAPEWQEVEACALPYKSGGDDMPAGVRFLVGAVDVQRSKLVYVIRGFGVRQESWLIAFGEIWGDTRLDDVWLDLWETVIDRRYGDKPVSATFIDSGFRPNDPELAGGGLHKVYEFCRRHPRQVMATKGASTKPQRPVTVSQLDITPAGKRPKSQFINFAKLDSDELKEWVHSRVRWPKDQPGGWHLPSDITEAYCREIVNEARMPRPAAIEGGPNRGYQWIGRGAHDFLDAEAMAFGCAKMIGLDRVVDRPPPPRDPPPPAGPTSPWLGGRTTNWLRR